MSGLNESNLFRMDCASCRAAIYRFLGGACEADDLITALRSVADLNPAIRPVATAWMEADRTIGLNNLRILASNDLALWQSNQRLLALAYPPPWHPDVKGPVPEGMCQSDPLV